jgi:hypothetical protein
MKLSGEWKKSDMPWRDSLNGVRPGIGLETVSSGERQRQGLPVAGMALEERDR